MEKSVVVRAPINIALIKYWGKRNEKLIIPWNDSVSLTINEFYAKTSITVGSANLTSDSVSINGVAIDLQKSPRFLTVFKEFRRLTSNNENGPPFVCVDSTTNFATSAGLASSAAGFAAIAYGLGQIGDFDDKTVVKLARIGSGSACRSVLKGFVHWIAGSKVDTDEETTCKTIPSNEWNNLRAIIFEFKSSEKEVSSTEGMRRTAETSELFKHRIEHVVPARVEKLKNAIKEGNFEELANVTMADSNQLHAICLDSQPPLMYLNDYSRLLINFVVGYNKQKGKTLAAYTFDAGPNCCVFIEQENVEDFLREFENAFRLDVPIKMNNGHSNDNYRVPLKQYCVSEVGAGPSLLE